MPRGTGFPSSRARGEPVHGRRTPQLVGGPAGIGQPSGPHIFSGNERITIGGHAGRGLPPGNHGLSSIFVTLFVRMDYWAAISLLLILLGALLFTQQPAAADVVAGGSDITRSGSRQPPPLPCARGSLFIYQNHPLAMDEYAPVLQSQAFAAGHLERPLFARAAQLAHSGRISELFPGRQSHQSGAVASAYWPSFALLLAPFTFLGIPWACNPLISAATLLVIHRLALRIFADRETAGLALLLTLASPVFLADGISYYSMSAHLLANSLFALLLTRPTPGRVFGPALWVLWR